MSISRQPSPSWKVLAKTHLRGRVLAKHAHSAHQLLFASSGVMQVQTDQGQWTVPPQHALWIPAGVVHSVVVLSDAEMRTVYFSDIAAVNEDESVHMVVASALLKALILSLFHRKHGDATRQLMASLLRKLASEYQEIQCYLPLPRNSILLEAATWFMSQRKWDLSLSVVAEKVGMSERSFTRHFSAEVGHSFRQWRQRARIVGSFDRLLGGDSIKQIASLAGFASTSAYIVAFKQVTGSTPAQFAQTGGHSL